ncbi:MAG: hypothetical protein WCA46_27715 [Actinocatenispora sp.]
MNGDLGWSVGLTVLGAALLVCVVLGWSGRWRGWAHRPGWDTLVVGWLPAAGLILLGLGLVKLLGEPVGTAVGSLLWLVGVVLAVVAVVYTMFRPRWYGPRWRHHRPGAPAPGTRDTLTAVAVGFAGRPGDSSAAKAREAFGGSTPVARWHGGYVYDPHCRDRPHGMARRGTVMGDLILHREGLVFAATQWEDNLRGTSTVLVLPAGDIAVARVVSPRADADGRRAPGALRRSVFPRLVVECADGRYLFEVTRGRATRVAARVTTLAGGDRDR